MSWFMKIFANVALDKILSLLKDWIEQKMYEAKIKKKTKEQMKEITSDPNRENRVKRLRDMLNN